MIPVKIDKYLQKFGETKWSLAASDDTKYNAVIVVPPPYQSDQHNLIHAEDPLFTHVQITHALHPPAPQHGRCNVAGVEETSSIASNQLTNWKFDGPMALSRF